MSETQQNKTESQNEIKLERSLVKVLNRISKVISESNEHGADAVEYETWKKKQFDSLMWRAPELSWKGWQEASYFLQSFCQGKR